MSSPTDQCAREIIDVIPLIMRVIRAEVRSSRFPELSLPEFRSLAFLGRNRGATLGDVAAHVGMAAPSASKLIEGLVSSQLVTRETDSIDRRRVVLALTPAGKRRYQVAFDTAVQLLDSRISGLSDDVKAGIAESMHALRNVFSEPGSGLDRIAPIAKRGGKVPAGKSSRKKQLADF